MNRVATAALVALAACAPVDGAQTDPRSTMVIGLLDCPNAATADRSATPNAKRDLLIVFLLNDQPEA